MTDRSDPLCVEIDGLLAGGPTDEALTAVIDRLLARFGCAVGTLHALDADTGLLHLRAQRGLPEVVLGKVGRIPVGKGMAGLAAERRGPVRACNLQSDDSGVAQPGAKLTRMEGSIALPILHAGELRGTFGVAKPTPYEYTEAETELLLRAGAVIGKHLG